MVGLSDIPCVGAVVDRISDATVEALFRGLRYLFCYKELFNLLHSEIENVNTQEDRMSRKIDEERTHGKIIEDRVLTWQAEVKQMQESAKEFSEKYNNRASWKCLPIPDPVSCFRLGREAVFKARKATQLIQSGKDLLAHEIAHLPMIQNLPRTDAEFQDFASRKGVYGKLWEALVGEDSSLVLGIYGMPGVGKTRMMEQIWQQAMEEEIFDKVVRVNVGSEKLDVIKIQNQIATHLHCRFVSQDNVESRASQLKNSLMNQGKILIILDDVWDKIPLEKIIGTSFGESSNSKGGKILLTSRKEDVCLQNNCMRPVQITTLKAEEAWNLFQETVGTDHINDLQDDDLAKKVCTKCAGLPLLIRAVGKALEFASHRIWTDALHKLENGDFKNIGGIEAQVYACVKLSIDILHHDARICLFLCSLFPEDADIDIRRLIQLTIGSQLLTNGESTIPAMVDILTKSSLLLKSVFKYMTKLHDLIRNVARTIAFNDPEYSFLHIRCGSRLLESASYRTSKLLRLDVEVDNVRFRDDLVCKDINTLWLHCNNHLQQFSGCFFRMFMNLEFLMLQNVHFLSMEFSLQPLGKLKMLFFDNCNIRETDGSLFPKNLKTLCIWDCNLPSPLDLPNLKYLQKLEIRQKLPEVIMVPNAISTLSSLEELHIPFGFSFSDDANNITRILDEINKLTCLTSLEICFGDFKSCQGTFIFNNLLKYDICVGRLYNRYPLPDSTRMIKVICVEVGRDAALESLVGKAEEVELSCTDVDVGSICNSDREAFADLRLLSMNKCDTVEYIGRISQDKIQHSRQLRTSFSKLTNLSITRCSGMRYLFSKSVAKCLKQLQKLEVNACPAVEVIVMNEGTGDGDIIDFSKLKTLLLLGLQSLRGFYREKKEMHRGSTDNSCVQYERPLFDGMVAFPYLERLIIESLEVGEIWAKHYSDDNNIVSSSFCKLKSLEIRNCSKVESVIAVGMLHRLCNLESLAIEECSRLRNAFPACIARDLIHLQILYIQSCGMTTEVIGGGEQEEEITDDGVIMFPNLKNLTLFGLENLRSFWCYGKRELNTDKVELPALVEFNMSSCGNINLEEIELGRDDSTCQLKRLFINSNNQTQLPCKWQLHLYNLETLTLRHCWWWHELISLCFPKLTYLCVNNCGRSTLFTISGFRSLQQLRALEISNCDLLEEIVEDDVRGVEHSGMDIKTFTIHLSSITLNDLPNLRSFSRSVSYAFSMPKLERFHLFGCPQLENFTYLKTSTGLVSVYTEGHEGEEVTDLNDFIIQNRKRGSNSVEVLENHVGNQEVET